MNCWQPARMSGSVATIVSSCRSSPRTQDEASPRTPRTAAHGPRCLLMFAVESEPSSVEFAESHIRELHGEGGWNSPSAFPPSTSCNKKNLWLLVEGQGAARRTTRPGGNGVEKRRTGGAGMAGVRAGVRGHGGGGSRGSGERRGACLRLLGGCVRHCLRVSFHPAAGLRCGTAQPSALAMCCSEKGAHPPAPAPSDACSAPQEHPTPKQRSGLEHMPSAVGLVGLLLERSANKLRRSVRYFLLAAASGTSAVPARPAAGDGNVSAPRQRAG